MGCYHPVRLKFWEDSDRQRTVPCGQCIGCKLERSRQWAVRIMHEASLYEENCFVTLTYDDAHLPPLGSLDRRAFPLFMKRFRKSVEPRHVRFFHAGEYGSLFRRPHYHACVFNYDFADKREYSKRGGFPVWHSAALEKLWPLGRSELGSVSFESAAYVARYLVKSDVGGAELAAHVRVDLETGETVELEPEYCTMSRRPGIGFEWIKRYAREVYAADSVIVRGVEAKPARYYDGKYELVAPDDFERVRQARRKARRLQNLVAGEVNARARLNLLKRGLE